MSCCGRSWEQAMAPRPPTATRSASKQSQRPAELRYASVVFEYVGRTRLVVVTGPVSGRRYEFDQPGRRVAVDPVDKPGISRVPNLRLIMRA
jgi:hypothetical protein